MLDAKSGKPLQRCRVSALYRLGKSSRNLISIGDLLGQTSDLLDAAHKLQDFVESALVNVPKANL